MERNSVHAPPYQGDVLERWLQELEQAKEDLTVSHSQIQELKDTAITVTDAHEKQAADHSAMIAALQHQLRSSHRQYEDLKEQLECTKVQAEELSTALGDARTQVNTIALRMLCA